MNDALHHRLCEHILHIYPRLDAAVLSKDIVAAFWDDDALMHSFPKKQNHGLWSEKDSVVITYGDTIVEEGKTPLQTLKAFFSEHLEGLVSSLHILPFFPFSSDDGFAVKDYYAVNDKLGTWDDISAVAQSCRLMADIVINHASSQGEWFARFRQGLEPECRYFMTAEAGTDVSLVVRPRSNPLLTATETVNGEQHVWCTFGADQVDLDFRNPDVLLEFIRIMKFYIAKGVRIFRLDAVAFLWKEIGTSCINRPQTHEIIRLLRTLTDFHKDDLILITETNIPNHENLSYFGHQDEAHLIYNFSLPPLTVHALLTGNATFLSRWMMSMPPAPEGCTYFNFIASHDGIGLRPAEGLLPQDQIDLMIDTVKQSGGMVSMRTAMGGVDKPYEMNVALFDALKRTIEGEDGFQNERFLASQTIMMGLEGMPAFYIHSLLATANDTEKYKVTMQKRSINRHQWDLGALQAAMADDASSHARVFAELKRRLGIRIKQAAFHPNATQVTLPLPETLVGFWRQSRDHAQSVFCITNVTNKAVDLKKADMHLVFGEDWVDLLTGKPVAGNGHIALEPYQTVWISNK